MDVHTHHARLPFRRFDVVGLDTRAEELLDDGVHRRPALTRMRILRGFLSAATNSGSVVAPTVRPACLCARRRISP